MESKMNLPHIQAPMSLLAQAQHDGYLIVPTSGVGGRAFDHVSARFRIPGFYDWCRQEQQPYARILRCERRDASFIEIDFITIEKWRPDAMHERVARRLREEAEAVIESYSFVNPAKLTPGRSRRVNYGAGLFWWHVDRCPVALDVEVMERLLSVARQYPGVAKRDSE